MSQSINYQDAWTALFSMKTPSIGVASSALLEISAALQVNGAIAQVFPTDFRRRLRPLKLAFEQMRFPKKDGDPSEASAIVSQLIDRNLCPLDEVWLNEEAMNFAEDFTLPIAIQGFKMSMEDFGDWISGDPPDVPDHLGIHTMIGLIWGWCGDEREIHELWRIYNDRFHWGIPVYPEFPSDHYLDVKMLHQKLKKAGAQSLYTLLLAIDGSTDSVFFDFDYEYWQAIELNTSSLISLHKDWQKALPLIDECNQALDLLVAKPEFYKVFLDSYAGSLRPRTQK
jgi:hypothetical protein